MTEPRYRSRSLRRVFKKTPGGRVTVHYAKRKPSSAKCGTCGKSLAGVPKVRPYKLENLPKSQKRPERPYGGVLCSKCSARKIITEARETGVKE